MACRNCPQPPPRPQGPTPFAARGMRVRVSTEAEVQALAAGNPGYALSRTVIGPQNILVTLTPTTSRRK